VFELCRDPGMVAQVVCSRASIELCLGGKMAIIDRLNALVDMRLEKEISPQIVVSVLVLSLDLPLRGNHARV
jgi:hypothetical protein